MNDSASARNEDYDSPWKDVLTLFFPEFMEFFFPQVYDAIGWSRGFEFLDKEMQRLSAKAAVGRRTVDKLARVWLKNGDELRVLIHIEVQGQRESAFPQRMFVYNYRLFDRHKSPVASFVIFTDEDSDWRPNEYRAEIFGTELSLKFTTVKLIDYRPRLQELEQSDNPFAVVVLAQLAASETHGNAEERFWKKLEIAKRLYVRGYKQQQVMALFEFLDSLLQLPDELDNEFYEKLDEQKGEEKMKYVSSIERIGIRKGVEIGRGEGSVEIVLRILKRRFGALDETVESQIRTLSLWQVEELSDYLLEFASLADLQSWLSLHPPSMPVNGNANGSLELDN
ncbi:MAG: Rpn family recombination-promoting nuclease/putative transposase [Blastocatellia bacterium]